MKKLLSTTALLFALASSPALAVEVLSLTGPIQGNILGPQSTSDPCIIAGTACSQPATIGFGNFANSGSTSSFNQWSNNADPGNNNGTQTPSATKGTPYTVGQLEGVVGSSFVVAIDVNTSGGAGGHMETLQSFQVLDSTTNVVIAQFTGPQLIGNIANNGNGFGDWQLGTINLAGLPTTDGVLFQAVWNNATDGSESFFLVTSTSAVPEPGTWALMLFGFVGLALAFRTRRRAIGYA